FQIRHWLLDFWSLQLAVEGPHSSALIRCSLRPGRSPGMEASSVSTPLPPYALLYPDDPEEEQKDIEHIRTPQQGHHCWPAPPLR
ncbi:hypothetical protein PMAYCL1PPCAC_19940, partial [Pristionchus mayeri]